jgi:hypothetical protein
LGGGGDFWFAAWLFTIGFLHLGFWRAVLALLIWPYYLGELRFINVREGISWLGCEELEEFDLCQLARHILAFLDGSWPF